MNDLIKNTLALLEQRKQAFNEKYSGAKIRNFTWLVERELDSWESDYFPIYEMLCLPKYQTLIDDHLVGVMDGEITVAKLTETVNRVRAKRKKHALKDGLPLHAVPGVQPGVSPAHPVGGSSVAVVYPPVGVMPVVQVVQPVEVPEPSDGVDHAWVYPKQSKVQPVEIEDWEKELIRLKREKAGKDSGWNVWNGNDEFMWQSFLSDIETFNRGRHQSEHWAYGKSSSAKFSISLKGQDTYQETYEYLVEKLDKAVR